MAAMDQFSHDLTLALEESSRVGAAFQNRWGMHRRTRSTGNLQDSSSSPLDYMRPPVGASLDAQQIPHSDSDESHAQRLNLNSQKLLGLQSGNFESDSFNENFSPARPNTRRKRKFKRMAVEYETTTPSTPNLSSVVFPNVGVVTATTAASITGGGGGGGVVGVTKKKRVHKHAGQENFRANLFFCGKRKRCHHARERSIDCEMREPKGHRFGSKCSYLEYKTCKKYDRHQSGLRIHEKILPLNKTIVSKIERISKDSKSFSDALFVKKTSTCANPVQKVVKLIESDLNITQPKPIGVLKTQQQQQPIVNNNKHHMFQKSGSLDSSFSANFDVPAQFASSRIQQQKKCEYLSKKHAFRNPYAQQPVRGQYEEDEGVMDCSMNGFVSSSSLSSSDSEAILTNESDREGDDELTDFPGNETMATVQQQQQQLQQQKIMTDKTQQRLKHQMHNNPTGGHVMHSSGGRHSVTSSSVPPPPPPVAARVSLVAACPMDDDSSWGPNVEGCCSGGDGSLGDVSSDPVSGLDVREIRAGCRRIRDERPGFSVLTSANELLSRFLQDRHQTELKLGPLDSVETDKLQSLANMYSLQMSTMADKTVLTKTSNTMQAVKVEQGNMSRRFLTDFKRRCYSVPDNTLKPSNGESDNISEHNN